MTMGALHSGHASLLQAARAQADVLVASVYVNPLQFGPGEDYEAYPRPREKDLALLEAEGVDIAFLPTDEDMYPNTPLVRIDPGPIATRFEGKTRPTHFAGVLQVVHKVFNLVRPDVTFFGQKDAQQLALVKTMVRDLDMGIDVQAVPIRRTEGGLALSSRNSYLNRDEYSQAHALYLSLLEGRTAAEAGAGAAGALKAARDFLANSPGVKIDYLELVDPETFEVLGADATGRGLLIVAAWVGPTRLIDNLEINL